MCNKHTTNGDIPLLPQRFALIKCSSKSRTTRADSKGTPSHFFQHLSSVKLGCISREHQKTHPLLTPGGSPMAPPPLPTSCSSFGSTALILPGFPELKHAGPLQPALPTLSISSRLNLKTAWMLSTRLNTPSHTRRPLKEATPLGHWDILLFFTLQGQRQQHYCQVNL